MQRNPHRWSRKTLSAALRLSVVLVAAGGLAVAASGSGASPVTVLGSTTHAPTPPRIPDHPSFGISGDSATLHPLYPGMAPAPLDLKFTNPYSFTLSIAGSDVHVAVGATTYRGSGPDAPANPDCAGSDLSVTQAPGWTITVPRHSTRSLSQSPIPPGQWPTIRLPDTGHNQDGCKGTTFNLSYTATATK